jgi:bifunctional enzyme CysN/CysC
VLCSFISPYEKDRAAVRALLPEGSFFEIFVHCPVEVCKERDPKGLYEKAERGEIANFTGVSSPYEAPAMPSLLLDSSTRDVDACVALVLECLERASIFQDR